MLNSGLVTSSDSYFQKLQNYPSESSKSQNAILKKATCEHQPLDTVRSHLNDLSGLLICLVISGSGWSR